jgi:hypothetical protein
LNHPHNDENAGENRVFGDNYFLETASIRFLHKISWKLLAILPIPSYFVNFYSGFYKNRIDPKNY